MSWFQNLLSNGVNLYRCTEAKRAGTKIADFQREAESAGSVRWGWTRLIELTHSLKAPGFNP
jgi:hypothetical protein